MHMVLWACKVLRGSFYAPYINFPSFILLVFLRNGPLHKVDENLSPDTPCTPLLFPQTQAAPPADRTVPPSSVECTDLMTETSYTKQSADRTDLTTETSHTQQSADRTDLTTETPHTQQSADHTDLMTETPHTQQSADHTDLIETPHTAQHSPEGTGLMTDCTAVSISRFSDKNAVIYRPQQSCATHIALYYGTVHK